MGRSIKRGQFRYQDLVPWNSFLNRVYWAAYGLHSDHHMGNYRAMPPTLSRLGSKYNDLGARWTSAESAIQFQKRVGIIPLDSLPKSFGILFGMGPFGVAHLNGLTAVALAKSDPLVDVKGSDDKPQSRWSAIALQPIQAGVVVAFVPCATSIGTLGSHIPITHAEPGVAYDVNKIVGRGSWPEWAAAKHVANCQIVSERYLDPTLPNYTGLRLLLVTTKPVSALQPLRVYRAGQRQVKRLNSDQQENMFPYAVAPVRGPRQLSLRTIMDVTASLVLSKQPLHAALLTRAYLALNLACQADEAILLSPQDLPSFRIWLHQLAQERIDYNELKSNCQLESDYNHIHNAVATLRLTQPAHPITDAWLPVTVGQLTPVAYKTSRLVLSHDTMNDRQNNPPTKSGIAPLKDSRHLKFDPVTEPIKPSSLCCTSWTRSERCSMNKTWRGSSRSIYGTFTMHLREKPIRRRDAALALATSIREAIRRASGTTVGDEVVTAFRVAYDTGVECLLTRAERHVPSFHDPHNIFSNTLSVLRDIIPLSPQDLRTLDDSQALSDTNNPSDRAYESRY